MRKNFPIYEEAVSHIWLCNCSILNFLIYEENSIFFSVPCPYVVRFPSPAELSTYAFSLLHSFSCLYLFKVLRWCRVVCPPQGGWQRDVVYLGWPIAPSYNEPKCGGGGAKGIAGSQPMSTAVPRALINFGDLTQFLTYGPHSPTLLNNILAGITL